VWKKGGGKHHFGAIEETLLPRGVKWRGWGRKGGNPLKSDRIGRKFLSIRQSKKRARLKQKRGKSHFQNQTTHEMRKPNSQVQKRKAGTSQKRRGKAKQKFNQKHGKKPGLWHNHEGKAAQRGGLEGIEKGRKNLMPGGQES